MRIALVITRSDSIGGAQVHVRDLAIALRENGHEPTVLVGGNGALIGMLTAGGVPVRSVPLVRELSLTTDLAALISIRRTLAEIRPDIVSVHSSKAGVLGRIAAWQLGLPVVFTVHGWAFATTDPAPRRALYLGLERVCARVTDRVITVSQHAYDLGLARRVASPSRLTRVHNGVPDVVPSQRAEPGHAPATILVVARLLPPKDFSCLFSALAGLGELPWTLRWVGDGPQLPQARSLAEQLGLADRVQFVGALDDVRGELSRAQLLVLPTLHEGLPLCILEAMRAGLPVVASQVGGIPEAVVDGETGRLVPSQDIGALRGALRSLLVDASLRVELGARGRQCYEDRFTFQRQFDATLAVYQEVVAAHERR